MSFKHLDQLNDFISDVFIETGTYHGNTARAAKDAGFKKVVTIELQDYLYEISKDKSKGYDIQFEKGDSIEVLKKVLPTIEGSITFWLDAHIDGGNYVPGITPEIRPCPLYEELDLIKNLERNDHTILIDDMRILGKLGWGLGTVKEIVIQKLLEINPNYSITYIDGEEPNDIMVAKITQ